MALTRTITPSSVRAFIFSLLVISSLSVKGVHLWSHLRSLSLFAWMTSLPFLFLEDVAVAIGGRLLLARNSKRRKWFDPTLLGFVLAVITTVAAATEIAFFWETSSEIDWSASTKFLSDPAGMKMLLRGWTKIFSVQVLLITAATASSSSLYNAVGNGLQFFPQHISYRFGLFTRQFDHEEKHKRRMSFATISGLSSNIFLYIGLLIIYFVMLFFHTKRTDMPSKHLLGSLPFTLIGNAQSNDGEFCVSNDNLYRRPFPLSDLITEKVMNNGEELSFSWAPWEFKSGRDKPIPYVDWLPKEPIAGFQRWYDTNAFPSSIHYNPRHDPLRISNTQSPMLETLSKAFQQNTVAIKNVLMITLESTRKDVFPLKNSSTLHNTILSSHESSVNPELNELLANISRTAEWLTGESSGFETQIIPKGTGTWRSLASNLGGINVPGAITAATYTLKNLLSSHCGVAPLPVDFAKEATHEIYQPCLPHVLGLFNAQKYSPDNTRAKDFRSQMWDTAFIQSVSDHFDSQSTITQKMGFSETVARDQLQDPKSKFYPPTEPESNYFGYPETQVKPHIRDVIERSRKNNRRFFISHLTSTTHHDWTLPASYGDRRHYMGRRGWQDHEDINDFLNTIKYADDWLGEIMDLLEDTGVIDETLVVLTGDHGFAFREDDASYSTYNGAHIANFRIPMVFYHPKLPRLHLTMNASSMSILPTIIDLLASSNSLDTTDQTIASHMLNEYEGQSLVREYQSWHHRRQAWQVALLSPGGTFLSITSGAFSYRLVMPLCHASMFRFTDLSGNEMEEEKLEDWSFDALLKAIKAVHGVEAAQWTKDAKAVGTWWFWEKRRLWKFGGATRNIHPGWNGTHSVNV